MKVDNIICFLAGSRKSEDRSYFRLRSSDFRPYEKVVINKIKHSIVLIILVVSTFSASMADVGETYELKNKRQQILNQIERRDSLPLDTLIQTLHKYQTIIDIDNQIFDSYKSTIYRTSNDEYVQKLSNRMFVYLAFLMSLLFVLALVIINSQSRRLKQATHNAYSLTLLAKEIFVFSLPLFQKNTSIYKVNKLLYISILVIAIVVFMGLVGQL